MKLKSTIEQLEAGDSIEVNGMIFEASFWYHCGEERMSLTRVDSGWKEKALVYYTMLSRSKEDFDRSFQFLRLNGEISSPRSQYAAAIKSRNFEVR